MGEGDMAALTQVSNWLGSSSRHEKRDLPGRSQERPSLHAVIQVQILGCDRIHLKLRGD